MAVRLLGGLFFGLRAGFSPFLTIPTLLSEVPLILVRGRRNLAGIPGAPKKWYGGPTEPVPTGITEKRPFLRLAEKRKTGQKSVFRYSNHPKLSKRLIFIWEKATFSFWQLCTGLAGTWLESKSVCFFLAQKSGFWPENPFFDMGPRFLSRRRLCASALAPFRHWARPIWSFRFRVTAVFVWGPVRRAKKSYPTPLWGHRLPVTALALSARRPFGPVRFALAG